MVLDYKDEIMYTNEQLNKYHKPTDATEEGRETMKFFISFGQEIVEKTYLQDNISILGRKHEDNRSSSGRRPHEFLHVEM